jgi:hypothetical protein
MAISSSMVWELRTTGNDNNGGSFKSGAAGTDRSQQDAAQVAIDNSTITVSITTNVITFVSGYTPSSADVGNAVQMLTGTNVTAGFYEITAQTPTTWTVDRNVVTSGTATDATGNMGGAMASPGKVSSGLAAGNKVWIKFGTYNLSVNTLNVSNGAPAPSVGGVSASVPMIWRGYDVTRGDETANRPTFKPTAATYNVSLYVLNLTAAHWCAVENLILDANSKANRGVGITGIAGTSDKVDVLSAVSIGFEISGGNISRCKATGCNPGFQAGTAILTLCEAVSGGGGFRANDSTAMDHCIARGCSGAGFAGIDTTRLWTCTNCVSYGHGSDGFSLGINHVNLFNCISYNNTGWGVNSSVGFAGAIFNCAVGSNIAGPTQNITSYKNIGLITLTANPFTSSATADFSLNTTSGGGALLRGTGYGTFPSGVTLGHPDVGAAQHVDSGGGGGSIIGSSIVTPARLSSE